MQEKCAKVCEELDKKYNIERDLQLSFTQLMEEVGELAEEINMPKLRNKEIDKSNLEGEFADIIIQLSILAKKLNVDFEGAVKSKLEIVRKRNNL